MLNDPVTLGLATGFVWAAVASSVIQILMHLRNYTEPLFQRYVIRIIFLVPFYGVTSWLSLMYRDSSIYFDVPRDCYEAWVIYNFLSLCMAYVGGPGAVVVKSEGKCIKPSWLLMTCCWPPIKVDGFLLRKCKQGTLQFVIAKPILAAFTLILFAAGRYTDGDWSPTGGYLYIAVIYNTCYTIALYYLLIFYVGCEELLQPFRPLLKIIMIKTVIFLTFWQSIAISFFSSKFPSEEDCAALQDWMVCLEMFMSACMMWVAFPHTEFRMGGQTAGWRLSALLHALSLQDVYSDIMHQFNPNYKTYVLYSDGGPSDNVKRKKFRAHGKKHLHKQRSSLSGASKTGDERKGARADRQGASISGADGEGEVWQPGKPGSSSGKKLFGWIPGISDSERKQAQLVDSGSDADYDDENKNDNQLDHTMLASSDSDDERLPHPPRISDAGSTDGRQRASSRTGGGDLEMGAVVVSKRERARAIVNMITNPQQLAAQARAAAKGMKKAVEMAKEQVQHDYALQESDDDDRML